MGEYLRSASHSKYLTFTFQNAPPLFCSKYRLMGSCLLFMDHDRLAGTETIQVCHRSYIVSGTCCANDLLDYVDVLL